VNGQLATKGMKVGQADKIVTEESDKSYADIKFHTGHTVRIKNGALFLKNISNQFSLHLKKGSLYAHVKKLFMKQTFRIVTPTSVAAIRGTKFFLAETDEESYLCVCQGKVWIKKKGLLSKIFGKTVTVAAGNDLHVPPGQAKGLRGSSIVVSFYELRGSLGF